jgi:heme oxygenase
MEPADIKQDNAFLRDLRQRTALFHTKLEKNPLSMQLMSASVSLMDYAAYIVAMKEVIAATEAFVFSKIKNVVKDVEERRKLPAIESDLALLGRHTIVPLCKKFELPLADFSEASALGAMYVVEGSTLGGRVIVRHLQQRPLLAQTNAFAFFNGYSEMTGTRWKNFLVALCAFAAATGYDDEIIRGAKQVFHSIDLHFTTALIHAR